MKKILSIIVLLVIIVVTFSIAFKGGSGISQINLKNLGLSFLGLATVDESGETVDDSGDKSDVVVSKPVVVPRGEGTDLPTFCSSVSQYGITWTFSQSVPCGQFINGDYWVLAPVTIMSITPNFSGGRNGFQINPSQFNTQGYDSGSGQASTYNASLVPSLAGGLTITSPSSIVKAVSNPGSSCEYNTALTCYLDTAAVLTVLTSIPPNEGADSFRPGFAGTQKTVYSSLDLQINLLPSLTPPNGVSVPSLSSVANNYQRVQLDYPGWQFAPIRPDKNMQAYGGDIAINSGNAALRILLNDPISSKMEAIINFVQAGIDYYSIVSNGGDYSTAGGGGHENGRKAPVAFAAILLDNQQMKNFVSNTGLDVFGENSIAALNRNGVPVAAQERQYCNAGSYWVVMHNIDPGSKTCADPYGYIDGGEFPLDGYQQTFSNGAVGGTLATILLPGGVSVWNNPVSIAYLTRWVPSGAWTQPDVCAPAPGVCVGGSTPGAACSSAVATYSPATGNVSFPCPGNGTCSLTSPTSGGAPSNPYYGVTYGPLSGNPNNCVPDTNPADGIGRFPNLHMRGHGGGYSSPFADAMWNLYIGTVGGGGGGTVPSAPSGLTVTPVSGSELRLNWNDNSNNESGFNIEYRLASGGSWGSAGTVGAGVTTFTHSGLTANTSYSYRVRAYNTTGNSSWSSVASGTTLQGAPNAPGNLGTTPESSNSIRLNWSDNSNNEQGFTLEYKLASGSTWLSVPSASALNAGTTVFTQLGLLANTSYDYRVRSYNTAGPSAWSNIASGTTLEAAPNAPSNLVATTQSSTSILLNWVDQSGNETAFQIERRQLPSGVFAVIAAASNLAPNTQTFTDTGLSVSTSYEYRVRAVGGGGVSLWSNTAGATTLTPFSFSFTTNPVSGTVQQSQSTQTTLTVTRLTGTAALVSFQASGLNASQGSFSFVPTSCTPNPSCTSTLTITTLPGTPITTYPLTLQAGAGSIIRTTPYSLTVQSGAPNVPSGLTITTVSSTQLRLNWSDTSTNEQGFNIEYKLTSAPGNNWLPAGTVAAGITTFTHSNLLSSTSYSYRVRAYNIVGASNWSSVQSGTTGMGDGLTIGGSQGGAGTNIAQAPVLTSISPASVFSNQSRTIDIYGSNFDFPGAILEGCLTQFCTSLTSSILSSSVIRYELVAGSAPVGTYDFRVRNLDGQTSNRLSLTVNAPVTIPSSPSNLAVTTLSTSELRLTWSDNSTNETRFEIERRSGGGSFISLAPASNLPANSNGYTDTGLSSNTVYEYRVRAANSVGVSPWSNVGEGRTANTPSQSGGGGGGGGGGGSSGGSAGGSNLQTPVSQMSISQLQELLASLRATLLALLQQRALGGGQLSSPVGSTTFTRDLEVGSEGPDVRELQILLNRKGFPVASSGVGSPGNEGTYFGNLTQLALIRFQLANGISPAVGYFGPKTRNLITSQP